MHHASAFSPDYATARDRLVHVARAAGWHHEAIGFGDHAELTIDALRLGPADAKRMVVVSSGLHGVEGHLGSAIQLSLLEGPVRNVPLPSDAALIVLHALNPYGFAHTRRVDPDNIDLNRNFLLPGDPHEGFPEGYDTYDPVFNPKKPPLDHRLFYPQAVSLMVLQGLKALKNILPVGQYEFDKGLFFGGRGPSLTQRLLSERLPTWFKGAERVLHVDFHSGIGDWATYKLFPNTTDAARLAHLETVFGADVVEGWDPDATSYVVRGDLGSWLDASLPEVRYDFVTAEFGTYHVLRIVEALRTENAHHHWGGHGPARQGAKRRLREAFAPQDTTWRNHCVDQGLGIVRQALRDVMGVA